MTTFKKTTHILFSIACAFIIQTKSYAEPANLSTLKTEVIAYHDSGSYQKELSDVIHKASKYIQARAKANQTQANPEKLAIVLDIDETSLSNYTTMRARDFADDREKMHRAWNDANAPVIKPMLSLYNKALSEKVAVFFVTGRRACFKQPTNTNLTLAGFKGWTGLYFKPDQEKTSSNTAFKIRSRADITKKGYTIVASIGDQYSDLNGGYAEKTFKLPNPYYYVP